MKSQSVTLKPDAELARWCATLSAEVASEDVPEDWHTTVELAELLKKSVSTTGKLLCAAIRAGKCERRNFRIRTGGAVRPVPHYRLK